MAKATNLACLLCISLLAGCMAHIPPQPSTANAPPAMPWTAFDTATMKAGMVPGHASITGQAFSKTVGGDVKYGAGNIITIVPDTDYVEQCVGISASVPTPCTDALQPYLRHVQADGEGRFEVDDLAPGKYLLMTVITWGVPSMYGLQTTGGLVKATVDLTTDTSVATAYLQ